MWEVPIQSSTRVGDRWGPSQKKVLACTTRLMVGDKSLEKLCLTLPPAYEVRGTTDMDISSRRAIRHTVVTEVNKVLERSLSR